MDDERVRHALETVGLIGSGLGEQANVRDRSRGFGPLPDWARAAITPQLELPTVGDALSEQGLLLGENVVLRLGRPAAPRAWVAPLLAALLALPQEGRGSTTASSFDLGGNVTLIVHGSEAEQLVRRHLERGLQWEQYSERDFANSAHYMGTKREVVPLIMGAIDAWEVPATALVDLMTGSGVVAGAFARLSPTWAADAQTFATVLARAQGGGYQRSDALALLEQLEPISSDHRETLAQLASSALETEDALFGLTADVDDLSTSYASFVEALPTYPDEHAFGTWLPLEEVLRARTQAARAPCLMTAYYSNIYFGVRQCIDLDAIRAAISSVVDESLQALALGALVATASATATTYGGHFAQPYAPAPRLSSAAVLTRVLENRSRSVAAEFEARLLALATQSEHARFPVRTTTGHWRDALLAIRQQVDLSRATVYLDPPYTRDEYSRYYHVLETLVRYDYPDVAGKGRVPLKGPWRFGSEFHTRSRTRRIDLLVRLITDILEMQATVLWSHSSGLEIPTSEVLERIDAREIATVAAGHAFKKQGTRARHTPGHHETLTLFRPN